MKEYAEIIATRTEILPGRYETIYEWKGDKNAKVSLCEEDVRKVPFPLKKVDENYLGYYASYVRTDISFWWIVIIKRKIKNAFLKFNNRLICTAHVWGLVYLKMGEIPTWKHAFLNRWKKRP